MTKVLLTGRGKWISKVIKEWKKPDGTVDRKWNMAFYPDDKSRDEIMELQAKGLKNRLKKDNDGWNISLSRPVTKMMKGEEVKFDPPYLKDVEGKDLGDTSIGNLSDCTVELYVYEHNVPGSNKKSIAARWEGATITKLIPYQTTGKSTPTEDEESPF